MDRDVGSVQGPKATFQLNEDVEERRSKGSKPKAVQQSILKKDSRVSFLERPSSQKSKVDVSAMQKNYDIEKFIDETSSSSSSSSEFWSDSINVVDLQDDPNKGPSVFGAIDDTLRTPNEALVGSPQESVSEVREPKIVDFFDKLGKVPSISDMSLDLSYDLQFYTRISKTAAPLEDDGQVRDIGSFVDPLTGEVIKSTTEEEEEEEEEEKEEEEEEPEDSSIVDDDELLIVEKYDREEQEQDQQKQSKKDTAFETFMEFDAPKTVVIQEGVDFEKMRALEEAVRNQRETKKFLLDLISNIVTLCEYEDPKALLRQNLDKYKLMHDLYGKVLQMDQEVKAKQFLNRKIVEFFRRRKNYRPITEDNPEYLAEEKKKYKESKIKLDQQLGIEEDMRTTVNLIIENLESELFDREAETKREEENLEQLIRKSLARDDFERMKTFVDVELNKMKDVRKEITDTRLLLIERQHTFAAILEKLKKLEDIGNGLSMHDFERLQTEIQALDKRIEERNNELSKLRARRNEDLHVLAHIKEKQQMLRSTIAIKKDAIGLLQAEKHLFRKRLYDMKIMHGRLRKDITEFSFKGGLIDKEALMKDFDETVDKLVTLRERVENLKVKYTDLELKVQKVGNKKVSFDFDL